MGNSVKAGGLLSCIATLAMMAMVSLFSYEASAFSATTSNNSSASQCNASTMEECLIVDHANLVFFADSEKSLKVTPRITEISKKKISTPNDKCGRPTHRGQPYNPCVPNPNDSKKAENCKTIYKDNNRNRLCK